MDPRPEDQYALARFLKEHREALGLNHRELADAIGQARGGRTVSPQAVQQWENTNPEAQTTRPNIANREALAQIFSVSPDEIERIYELAKYAMRHFAPRRYITTNYDREVTSAASGLRRTALMSIAERRLRDALHDMIEGAEGYIEARATVFSISKMFDYLSPKVAAEWVMAAPDSMLFKRPLIEARLYRLLWLAGVDKGLGFNRQYLFIFIRPSQEMLEELGPDEVKKVQSRFAEYFSNTQHEVRLVTDRLDVQAVDSPEEAAALIAEYESN